MEKTKSKLSDVQYMDAKKLINQKNYIMKSKNITEIETRNKEEIAR
jgi:hypothetical protein